jgi:imidazoleglycerol phosphate synthase glutamine amidotransferase subunit HisH
MSMNTVIIKYNAGNIQSVLYALERIGVGALVTDEPGEIRAADKVIFPGVGEASTAMSYLKERNDPGAQATRAGHLPWHAAHVHIQRRE